MMLDSNYLTFAAAQEAMHIIFTTYLCDMIKCGFYNILLFYDIKQWVTMSFSQ